MKNDDRRRVRKETALDILEAGERHEYVVRREARFMGLAVGDHVSWENGKLNHGNLALNVSYAELKRLVERGVLGRK